MRATVSVAISDRPVRQENLVDWANREVQPALRQLREAANFCSTARGTAQSDGAGSYVDVWVSDELPTDAAWNISATVAGMSVSGVNRAGYTLIALAASIAGTVTLTATTTVAAHETAGAIDARFAIDGRTVVLEARDAATGPMLFVAVVQTTEVRSE